MKPSAEQMMAAAQQALRDLVAPTVTDQWAASALRSVDVILSHLQARTPDEGPMLYADNRDLVALLASAPAALLAEAAAASEGQSLGTVIGKYIGETEKNLLGYPSVATLSDLNIRGRALVDDLLLLCHGQPHDPDARTLHERLRAYLMRHLERETPYFIPTFVGRPV